MLQRPVKLSFRERLTVHGYQCTLAFYPNLEDRDAYREEFADMGGDRPKLKECYYIYDYEHGRMLNTSVMKNFFQPNHPALEDSYVNWDRPRQDAMGTMPKQQQELDRLQHWAMLAFKDPSVKHAVLRLDVSDETIRYGYKGAYTARVKTAFFLMNISWQYVNPSLKVQNERSQLQGESPTSAWHQRRGTGQSAASASTQGELALLVERVVWYTTPSAQDVSR